MEPIWIIILLSAGGLAFLYMGIRFGVRLKRYEFIGNVAFYIIVSYLVCLMFALAANLKPISLEIVDGVAKVVDNKETVQQNYVVSIATSMFDALRMMAVAFDRSRIENYINSPEVIHRVFAYGYGAASILALIFASITTVLSFFKTFKARFINRWRMIFHPRREIYYIFSDPKVTIAEKLALELKEHKKIVTMFLTRSSQKTQEGTEYKDRLVSRGLVVRTESFGKGIAKYIFKKHFNKQFNPLTRWTCYAERKVYVFGLFSDDETSVELGNNFLKAIVSNGHFNKLWDQLDQGTIQKKDFSKFDKIRVYLTYHNTDLDITNEYSKRTCQIISTLSEYDMISSEFILNNQISNFVDVGQLAKNPSKDHEGFNVTFLGFGNINRPIFAKMSFAYQLWGDNINKVHYHVLDRESETLIERYQNRFTGSKKDELFLYHIDADLDGQDLMSYEVINNYFKKIHQNEKDIYKNRFLKDGFEIFVVSVCDTNTDVRIALSLRKAILNHFNNEKDQGRLDHTLIFVRIGNSQISEQFKTAHESEVISQDELNDGYLFKNNENRKKVPIVIFGENTLMSEYISNHLNTIMKLALCSEIAYHEGNRPEDKEEAKTFDPERNALLDWYKKDKKKVIKNTSTVYSLKAKLELLGYELTPKYELRRLDGKDFTKKDIVTDMTNNDFLKKFDLSNKVFQIASLEHNRWMATEYLLFKTDVMDLNYFFNHSLDFENSKIDSRTPDKTKHVCMITNVKLHQLMLDLIGLKKGAKFDKEAKKLCYFNDINMLIKMFETLEIAPKEVEKEPTKAKKEKK